MGCSKQRQARPGIRSVQARKYLISKVDGSDIDPDAKYFVMRYDSGAEHGAMARMVLLHYAYCAKSSQPDMQELAADLIADLEVESNKWEADRE